MASINKVILVGNLGQDPEVKYMPSGGAVTNISVATTDSWKDKASGEKRENTEWHRVVFFNRLAEIAGEYLRKGSQIYIEGNLRTRSWEDNGVKKYSTEIVVRELQMLGSASSNSGGQSDRPAENYAQAGSYPTAQAQAGGRRTTAGSAVNGASRQSQQPQQHQQSQQFDDDIPF